MVGVVVGDDDAGDRAAGERAGEGALPGGADGGGVEAGVDDRPAVAVVEGVGVDVVGADGEGQADPEDAVGDRQRLAGAGRLGEGEAEGGAVHGAGRGGVDGAPAPVQAALAEGGDLGEEAAGWKAARGARAGSAAAALAR